MFSDLLNSPHISIHMCIKHKWDGLNISLLFSLSLPHHYLPFWASLANFRLPSLLEPPTYSFQQLFKVSTFSKRPLRMCGGNMLILFDFWNGSSVFLIHWQHGWLLMKKWCGFQWTLGGHTLNPEPVGLVGKYLPPKALKWRGHHLRYYIIH